MLSSTYRRTSSLQVRLATGRPLSGRRCRLLREEGRMMAVSKEDWLICKEKKYINIYIKCQFEHRLPVSGTYPQTISARVGFSCSHIHDGYWQSRHLSLSCRCILRSLSHSDASQGLWASARPRTSICQRANAVPVPVSESGSKGAWPAEELEMSDTPLQPVPLPAPE